MDRRIFLRLISSAQARARELLYHPDNTTVVIRRALTGVPPVSDGTVLNKLKKMGATSSSS